MGKNGRQQSIVVAQIVLEVGILDQYNVARSVPKTFANRMAFAAGRILQHQLEVPMRLVL